MNYPMCTCEKLLAKGLCILRINRYVFKIEPDPDIRCFKKKNNNNNKPFHFLLGTFYRRAILSNNWEKSKYYPVQWARPAHTITTLFACNWVFRPVQDFWSTCSIITICFPIFIFYHYLLFLDEKMIRKFEKKSILFKK